MDLFSQTGGPLACEVGPLDLRSGAAAQARLESADQSRGTEASDGMGPESKKGFKGKSSPVCFLCTDNIARTNRALLAPWP